MRLAFLVATLCACSSSPHDASDAAADSAGGLHDVPKADRPEVGGVGPGIDAETHASRVLVHAGAIAGGGEVRSGRFRAHIRVLDLPGTTVESGRFRATIRTGPFAGGLP